MDKYRILLRYARPQARFLWGIFALTVLASAFMAVQPWPMKLAVDYVLGGKPLPDGAQKVFLGFSLQPTRTTLLIVTVVGGLAIFLVSSTLEAILTWSWTVAGRRMVYDLAEDLFARLQRRSLSYHNRTSVGDTLGRVAVDCWSLYKVFDVALFTPGHAFLTSALMIVLMVRLDPFLAIVAMAIAPLMIGASFLIGKPLRAAAGLKRAAEIRIQSHVQQTLTGIPVVQAFAQEERAHAQFEQFADTAVRAEQRTALIGSLNSLSSGLVTTLGTGVILWIGAIHVLQGKSTIGSILLFLFYLGALQTQMKMFGNIYTALQGLRPSVDRVVQVLTTPAEIVEKPDPVVLENVRGNIAFENVTFAYDESRRALSNVSFSVKAGETIALVGRTGAGKSTLVALIPRFFDPLTGRVTLDGHDLRDLKISSLRSYIATVPQEPFLFPFSVADNIAYGRPKASRQEIEAAAHMANAHEFIQRLPDGYDTVLGERGGTLSGGERQRLSIARAVLKDAPVLILDEPTSAIDLETEQSLLQALDRLMAGKTTFIVGHRLSTVRLADRIMVLDRGRIAETGTHDQLITRGEIYAGFHLRASEGIEAG